MVSRICESGTDVILNPTTGMGSGLVIGRPDQPLPFNLQESDMIGIKERSSHVRELFPEICTLDCGTMNFCEGNYLMVNTPETL